MSSASPLPNVQQIVERELSQLDFSQGRSKEQILAHFHMAPTLKAMLSDCLPNTRFDSASAIVQAVPSDRWAHVQQAIQHGSPESHYLQSRAANFSTYGETSGFGHIDESDQAGPQGRSSAS